MMLLLVLHQFKNPKVPFFFKIPYTSLFYITYVKKVMSKFVIYTITS